MRPSRNKKRMKKSLKQYLQNAERWLLQDNRSPVALVDRVLKRSARILFAVVRDLVSGSLTLHAMSLVYTTILSTVPLLALCFSVLKAFNVQDKLTPMMYQFLAPMGEKGLEIHQAILTFVSNIKVGLLGALGFIFLLYTVISLIQKIEAAFNTIWHVPNLRSFSKRFSNYLGAIFIGPIFIVLAVSITAATMNSSLVQSLAQLEPFGSLLILLTKVVPFLTVILAFSFFYTLMPNTKVNFRSALVGAVIAGICWQGLSIAFASFVIGSTKYDAIYSGFAVGILLLIWVYVNWLVLLMGASISFYFQNGNYITKERDIEAGPELLEKLGLEVMVKVASRFEAKATPLPLTEVERMHYLPGLITRRVIDALVADGLLLIAERDVECLVPGRSTDKITVKEIFEAIRRDRYKLVQHLPSSEPIDELMNSLNSATSNILDQTTLRDLLKK